MADVIESAELVDRLAAHRTVGAAPRRELEWLAVHGELRRLEEGDLVSMRGDPVEGLFVVLSGHLEFYVDRASGREKVIEWFGGDVTGVLPYSRLGAAPGNTTAQ